MAHCSCAYVQALFVCGAVLWLFPELLLVTRYRQRVYINPRSLHINPQSFQIDLDVERVVTKDEGEKWAIAHKLPYWETSAASGSGVYETFHTMLGDVVELLKRSKHDINKS